MKGSYPGSDIKVYKEYVVQICLKKAKKNIAYIEFEDDDKAQAMFVF